VKILVIDDEPGLRKSLSLILGDAGYTVVTASDGEEGLRKLEEDRPELVLCDIRMPGLGGLDFLARARESGTEALILIMTAYGSMDLAVQAMKAGAYDYIPKPFGADEVLLTIRKAEEREQLQREVGRLRQEVRADRRFGEIVARSPGMMRVLELAGKVARHPSPVLVTGASGTGKELVARLIHRESDRSEGAFVAVNCGAIPETLLESEFFGYEKGAFSGADRQKAGLFEAADGGTLFLDEVGDLPHPLQVKLLRALQEGEIRRLGGTETRKVDVRVISATNKDLEDSIEQGEFREDLYYRLAVVPIHLPPLRHRLEEIPHLVRHILDRAESRLGIRIERVEPDAMEVLTGHHWPGNIRELENVLERAVVLTDTDRITLEQLPDSVKRRDPTRASGGLPDDDLSVKRHTAELERELIRKALERTGGNKTQAAEVLDLSPRALRYKIKDYGLE
jgi:two-component system, NtrC family, response regulator AtoC